MGSTKLEINEDIIKRQLLINKPEEELSTLLPPNPLTTAVIKPTPGICVKTKDNKTNEKVFVNVCISDTIPAPEDISSEELVSILESDNPCDFRIPMSIGSPHEETDKAGVKCTAYDVIINPKFFEKMSENPLFGNFFMIVTIEGLDEKYGISLDKNCWIVLKNKKYHGSISDQRVRTSVPLVQELSGIKKWTPNDFPSSSGQVTGGESKENAKPLLTEIKSTKISDDASTAKRKPNFRICEENPGKGSSATPLKIEVDLPEVLSAEDISVYIGEDRVTVETEAYFLNELTPHPLKEDSGAAFFIKNSRILVLVIELHEK